jgi:Rrf2 family protein
VFIALQNRIGIRPGYREIARNTGSPEQFTAKVLQKLTRAALIKSVRGRNGGFYFSDPDKLLYLADVLRVFEAEGFANICGFGFDGCDSSNPCPVHDQYIKIRTALNDVINNESIQSMTHKIMEKKAVLSRELPKLSDIHAKSRTDRGHGA